MGVSFAVPSRWEGESLRRALNSLLPRDCWVETVRAVQPGFHARRSAQGRRYRYDIGTDPASQSPFRRPYEWALGRPLDTEAMQAAADCLIGVHEFRAFAAKPAARRHCRCTVREATWRPRRGPPGVSFHIAADRFLHHMVRFLVGTMVDIGLGRRPPEEIATLLEAMDNQHTSPPAPPQGLFFEAAEYPAELFLPSDEPVPA
jgi:tRNA pseudouridine38-40 synthase